MENENFSYYNIGKIVRNDYILKYVKNLWYVIRVNTF